MFAKVLFMLENLLILAKIELSLNILKSLFSSQFFKLFLVLFSFLNFKFFSLCLKFTQTDVNLRKTYASPEKKFRLFFINLRKLILPAFFLFILLRAGSYHAGF